MMKQAGAELGHTRIKLRLKLNLVLNSRQNSLRCMSASIDRFLMSLRLYFLS